MNTNNGITGKFTKTIWTSRLELFKDKIKRLNRKLVAYGKEPITYEVTNVRMQMETFVTHMKGEAHDTDTYEQIAVEVCDIICKGLTTLKKDDKNYVYIGTVSFEDGVKQIFVKEENYLPYFNDKFREDYCDHCGTKRKRKSYHLFVTEDGNVMQIGNVCAKDYFGIDCGRFLNVQMDTFSLIVDGDIEEAGDFSRGSMAVDFKAMYSIVDYCTKGFTKWNKRDDCSMDAEEFFDMPTTEAVKSVIRKGEYLKNCGMGEKIVNYRGKNKIDLTQEECIAYWENQQDTAFTINCRNAIKAGYTTYKSVGTFAYAIFGAVNAKVKEAIKKATMGGGAPCAYKEGTRVNLDLEVITYKTYSEITYYTYRGENTTFHSLNCRDKNGTIYHFKTSSGTFADIADGDKIEVRATIGETKPFKGIDYTFLLRPKLTKKNTNKVVA